MLRIAAGPSATSPRITALHAAADGLVAAFAVLTSTGALQTGSTTRVFVPAPSLMRHIPSNEFLCCQAPPVSLPETVGGHGLPAIPSVAVRGLRGAARHRRREVKAHAPSRPTAARATAFDAVMAQPIGQLDPRYDGLYRIARHTAPGHTWHDDLVTDPPKRWIIRSRGAVESNSSRVGLQVLTVREQFATTRADCLPLIVPVPPGSCQCLILS